MRAAHLILAAPPLALLALATPASAQTQVAGGPWLIKMWFVPHMGNGVTRLDTATEKPRIEVVTDALTKADCKKQRQDDYGFHIDTDKQVLIAKCEKEAP